MYIRDYYRPVLTAAWLTIVVHASCIFPCKAKMQYVFIFKVHTQHTDFAANLDVGLTPSHYLVP